ncbi:endonuclease/exonuclease/phosphatase family protein [Kribbella sp. NBC_01245]|uniref:endonuclease/exonuclease/phosphatase family protein n=1 Tax=Kribbella sp. NBC_01245 TaxID=2903578 RepID=UPI002E2DC28F|nr:endonuclease/exonuclease/phosphatase family protein [Kribbella sp. NBC_01245]
MTALIDRPAPAPSPRHRQPTSAVKPNRPGKRSRLVIAYGVLTAATILLHGSIPNRPGNLGSLVETLLPWSILAVPVLLVFAIARRSVAILLVMVMPLSAWLATFGATFADKQQSGTADLTVVSHNVSAVNSNHAGTATALAASGADLIALEELSRKAIRVYERVLEPSYRYHVVEGTVGLWSKYPIADSRSVDIYEPDRALRTTVETPRGPVAVFVAHLSSVRVKPAIGFMTNRRNYAAKLLGEAIRTDRVRRTILAGDFNGTTLDRALTPLTDRLVSVQDEAGQGFGLTWPAILPIARIDNILVRNVKPLRSWTLPATTSDHLPIATTLAL